MDMAQVVTDWKNGQCAGAREQLESTHDPAEAQAMALLCISLSLHSIAADLTAIRAKLEERFG